MNLLPNLVVIVASAVCSYEVFMSTIFSRTFGYLIFSDHF